MTTLDQAQAQEFTRPTHVFRGSDKQVWIYFSMSIVFGALAVASLAINPNADLRLFPAIVAMGMAIWISREPPIRLFEDRIEMKSAPLAPVRVIEFEDIAELDESKGKRVRIRCHGEARGKGTKIPLHLLTKRDRTRLLNKLGMSF